MPYQEELHYGLSEGINRIHPRNDPKFPDGALWSMENMVYFRDSDNPEVMRNATRLGATDMGGDVTGLFDYNNGDKLIAVCTDGKIYEYGSDWAALATGARKDSNSTTASTRWAGVMFYGATTTKNLLILANDDDADDPIKYDTTNGAVTLGGSSPGNGKYPVVWQGRLWLFDGSTAYYSAADDAEDFTTGGGGGNVEIYRGFDGNITGAAAFANNLFVFKRSSIYRIAPTATFNNINVRNVSSRVGCVSHNTITEVGSGGRYLGFMSERGVEAVSITAALSGFYVDDISRPVKEILDTRRTASMSASWGMWNLDRREYMVSFPTGSSATVPKTSLIANFGRSRKPPRWTQVMQPNLTAGVVFVENNTDYIQYVGDNNGRVYKMHAGTMNLNEWDGAPFVGKVETKFYTQNRPNYMKQYGWAFVDAEKNADYPVTVRQNLLRRGLPALPTGGNTDTLGIAGSDGWGDGEWGSALWGGSYPAGERMRPVAARRGAAMRLLIESNYWYRLRGIVIASRLLRNQIAA